MEFAVLEWDGVFCCTDTSFLNQLLVIALKRQHKNNSCTSIILPLCRLREELNFSSFPANIVSAFSIHFLVSISLRSISVALLPPSTPFFLPLVAQSSSWQWAAVLGAAIPGGSPGSVLLADEEPCAGPALQSSTLQMFLLFVISSGCHTLIFVLYKHSCRACQQECFLHKDAAACVSDVNFELMSIHGGNLRSLM